MWRVLVIILHLCPVWHIRRLITHVGCARHHTCDMCRVLDILHKWHVSCSRHIRPVTYARHWTCDIWRIPDILHLWQMLDVLHLCDMWYHRCVRAPTWQHPDLLCVRYKWILHGFTRPRVNAVLIWQLLSSYFFLFPVDVHQHWWLLMPDQCQWAHTWTD